MHAVSAQNPKTRPVGEDLRERNQLVLGELVACDELSKTQAAISLEVLKLRNHDLRRHDNRVEHSDPREMDGAILCAIVREHDACFGQTVAQPGADAARLAAPAT